MNGRRLSRREALRRAALLSGVGSLPFSFAAATESVAAPFPAEPLAPINAPGYGTDPDLLHPRPVPWPNTLSESERALASTLADILLPREGDSPAATEIGAVDVLDEWLSAPYPVQQTDRDTVLQGFRWLDAEAARRFGSGFVALKAPQQLTIIDDIAFPERDQRQDLAAPRRFFDRLRLLMTGIYYSSPAGWRELGYEGNVPIAGNYPGPDQTARAHLETILKELGLD